jgi:hypothetical protein
VRVRATDSNQTITIEEWKKLKSKKPTSKTKIAAFEFFERCLKENCMGYKFEFKFSPNRKFSADMAFYFNNTWLLEYEGLNLKNGAKKSGHTTPQGYTNNCEKYNLAAIMGYRVLRYTALNYKDFEADLKKIVNGL